MIAPCQRWRDRWHQGNHVYAFALERGLRRRLQGKGQDYPKLTPPLFASTAATSNHVEKIDMEAP